MALENFAAFAVHKHFAQRNLGNDLEGLQQNSPLLRRTSVLRSKTLAQGGFTPPERVKSPLG